MLRLKRSQSKSGEKREVKNRQRQSTKKERFLRAFSKCGIVTLAAKRSQVNPGTHYKWLASDPSYPERFAEAQQAAVEYLEELLLRKAEGGDTACIIFALKAANPAKYRDNYRVEMSGPNGHPIRTETTMTEAEYVRILTDEELNAIIWAGTTEEELAEMKSRATEAPAVISGPLRIAASPLP
jgi:hypothetical protein